MFMFQETELETEKRRDKKWLKKVDRTQNSKVGIRGEHPVTLP